MEVRDFNCLFRDTKHREIHEKALLHFFDPRKKGQKFEYHQTQRQVVPKPTPPSQEEVDLSTTSRPYQEGQSSIKGTEFSFNGQRDQSYKTEGSSGADIGRQGAGHQRALGSTMVPNPLNSRPQETLSSMGGRHKFLLGRKVREFPERGVGRPGIQNQGARPKETTSFTKQPQQTNGGQQILHSAFLQPLSLM